MKQLVFGTYNLGHGGFDDGRDDRLRHQLSVLTEVGADAWAFQECNGWRGSGGEAFFTAERILGMRGFVAPSSHHGSDLAVFVRESAGLRVTAERHAQGYPYWHAVARVVIATPWPGGSLELVSGHLAPSPSIRLSEAETLALLAEGAWVIVGGDWHALPASDPEPPLDGIDPAAARRTLDRSAAFTLEEAGFTDVGAYLDDLQPTVGHAGGLRYRRDRVYTTLPTTVFVNYRVITEYEPASDHRPVVATFDITDLRHRKL